jgi:Protein of unknown function (DUF3995)
MRQGNWAAYAACAWALAFALMSFYWAAGGLAAIDTIGGEPERLARARDSEFVAAQWVIGAVKVLAAVAALALVRSYGRGLPRRLLVLVLGVGGALVLLYEAAELVQHLLMAVGAIDQGDLDDTALIGHLAFWDPWWILGASLFVIAAWQQRDILRPQSSSSEPREPTHARTRA